MEAYLVITQERDSNSAAQNVVHLTFWICPKKRKGGKSVLVDLFYGDDLPLMRQWDCSCLPSFTDPKSSNPHGGNQARSHRGSRI